MTLAITAPRTLPSPKRALLLMSLPAVLLSIIVVAFAASRGGSVNERELRAALPYLIAINHAVVFGVLLLTLHRERRSLGDIGWQVPRGASLLREIGLGLGAALLLYLFKELVFDSLQALMAGNRPTYTTLFRFQYQAAELPLLVTASIFVLVEESIYRGYGLPPLLARWSKGAALLTMAGLFGLLHWGNGPVAVLYTAVMGLGLAGLFLWRRTLLTPTLAHALYNALIVLA